MASTVVVLAPSRPPAGDIGAGIERLLAKADAMSSTALDDQGLCGDLFTLSPTRWPAAALSRQADAGDAGEHAWLRADPAHFRVERANVRLLACGDIGQTRDEVDELVAALSPAFGDEGFELSATHAHRWYLRPFAGNAAPDFPDLPSAQAALGGDLFELWREDAVHRRWRRVFNEVQIILARHPVNMRREQAGRPAINGLWFWGAGRLPARVATPVTTVLGGDSQLSALAAFAGIETGTIARLDASVRSDNATVVLDLRRAISVEESLGRLLDHWQSGAIGTLSWRTSNGTWLLRRWHRWRFWR